MFVNRKLVVNSPFLDLSPSSLVSRLYLPNFNIGTHNSHILLLLDPLDPGRDPEMDYPRPKISKSQKKKINKVEKRYFWF